MSQAAVTTPGQVGRGWCWIRNARFDQLLILGTATSGLAAGAVVLQRPDLLPLLLALDALILGREHVVSGYTRIAMDGDSFRQHRFLVIGLPVLVLAGVSVLYATAGPLVVHTVYFHWQWFHYVRQSYGVERIYARSSGNAAPDRLTTAVIYLVPVWGLLARSESAARQGATFLRSPLYWLPVPTIVVHAAGAAAILALCLWLVRSANQLRQGRLPLARALYLVSHVAVFVVAYIGISGVDHGWLVVNVWHNFQYILIVWLFNANRFRNGVAAGQRFLSTLSQPRVFVAYLFAIFAIATAFYMSVDGAAGWLAQYGLPGAAILYSTLNFHHYIMDAVVWRLRKRNVRAALGLSAG